MNIYEHIDLYRKEYKIEPHRLKKIKLDYFQNILSDDALFDKYPDMMAINLHSLTIHSHHISNDGSIKVIWKTADNLLVESVILRISKGSSQRISLCVSCQVGCAMGCTFCSTGKLGLKRNLSVFEICDQLQQSNQLLRTLKDNRTIRNVVFMGQGEPTNNFNNVKSSISLMMDKHCFNLAAKHITISSVGIANAIPKLAPLDPKINFALSLHSARQEIRETIMPTAKANTITKLRESLLEMKRPLMIEYLMLKGVTDTDDDVKALSDFCKNLNVHMNLIPYNTTDGVDLVGTSSEDILLFRTAILPYVKACTIRNSLGADVWGACGNLMLKTLKKSIGDIEDAEITQ